MNLLNSKDCAKCINSIIYGNKDNYIIRCTSDNYDSKNLFEKDDRYCASYCKEYKQSTKKRSGIIKQENAIEFILAGNSEFILHSTKTNDDFRFLITANDRKEVLYFVNMIIGSQKIYAGYIKLNKETQEFDFKQGEKGKIQGNELSIRSLLFVLNKLNKGETVGNLEVYHVGKCGCCGKELYEQADIMIGLHKKCNKNNNINKIDIKH